MPQNHNNLLQLSHHLLGIVIFDQNVHFAQFVAQYNLKARSGEF